MVKGMAGLVVEFKMSVDVTMRRSGHISACVPKQAVLRDKNADSLNTDLRSQFFIHGEHVYPGAFE